MTLLLISSALTQMDGNIVTDEIDSHLYGECTLKKTADKVVRFCVTCKVGTSDGTSGPASEDDLDNDSYSSAQYPYSVNLGAGSGRGTLEGGEDRNAPSLPNRTEGTSGTGLPNGINPPTGSKAQPQ